MYIRTYVHIQTIALQLPQNYLPIPIVLGNNFPLTNMYKIIIVMCASHACHIVYISHWEVSTYAHRSLDNILIFTVSLV